MFFSKIALVVTWWKLSLAAVATADNDDCSESPDVEMSVGARALLQHSGNALPAKVQLHSADGKCLNFLHIPKNAGASMEDIRRERQRNLTQSMDWTKLPREQKDAFQAGKIALPWADADHVGWGWGQSLFMSDGMDCEDGDEKICRLRDQFGHTGQCPKFHVPPEYDSTIAAAYDGCETFCISRNPLTKAVSQHIFVGGQCDVASFAEKVKQMAAELQSDPFKEDCHWVPQTMYTKHCQRVLRLEHLEEDFQALMQEYGYPQKLLHEDHGFSHCDIGEHPELIPPETLQWIQTYYETDFADLSYSISAQ